MASEHPVESLNALPLSTYRNKLLDPQFTGIMHQYPGVSMPLSFSLESPKTISSADFRACFELIASTSSSDYAGSSIGWSPAKKREEMRLPDMRYLLLKPSESVGENYGDVMGFLSFMVTYEDGYEVVYCYEIHLAPELQCKGIGKQLMKILETIGRKAGMQKAMLTVLMGNDSARRFYARLGYEVDEFSPMPRKLRSGIVHKPDYAILSKDLRESIRRPEHVTGKKCKTG
ncbi:MAG: hypothetical protein Q9217_000586 [Psora testacea]